jgi:hypothetical protein
MIVKKQFGNNFFEANNGILNHTKKGTALDRSQIRKLRDFIKTNSITHIDQHFSNEFNSNLPIDDFLYFAEIESAKDYHDSNNMNTRQYLHCV